MMGWTIAAICMILALFPKYHYVRAALITLAVVIASYCGIALLGGVAARICSAVLSAGVGLGLVLFGLTGAMILRAARAKPAEKQPFIVVLGSKLHGSEPTRTLLERIEEACDYLRRNPHTVAILSGGMVSDERMTEAKCMFDVLTARGIEPERLWLEENAASTWENLKFSLDLIEEKTHTRPDSLAVVSSEFHLYRVSRQGADCGVEILGIPAKTREFQRWLHHFIREICGVWHYLLLRGRYQ